MPGLLAHQHQPSRRHGKGPGTGFASVHHGPHHDDPELQDPQVLRAGAKVAGVLSAKRASTLSPERESRAITHSL